MSRQHSSIPRAASGVEASHATRVRYKVLILTFVTAFIMYVDRTCMGMATPYIQKEFGLDMITMGWVASTFNWAYSLFQVPGGWMADRYGSRIVLTAAMASWSAFTIATGLAFNPASLVLARFGFGLGEAAAFPAASRALVRWLPMSRRAFGQGFQHAGSRSGAALTPPIVLYLIYRFDWHSVFYLFGAVGMIWTVIWYRYYRDYPQQHHGVNQEEMDILADTGLGAKKRKADVAVPWSRILRNPNVWFLSNMYFCYGWVLWMYIQWLPTYLAQARGLSSLRIGLAASLPLFAATVANALGGWLSDHLTRRTNNLRHGRLGVSILGFLVAGISLVPAVSVRSAVAGTIWLSVALAGLELTVAVSWAICLDIAGEFSGSVSGVMNTFGNVGGALSSIVIAYLATHVGWNWAFLTGSFICLAAAILASRIDPGSPSSAFIHTTGNTFCMHRQQLSR